MKRSRSASHIFNNNLSGCIFTGDSYNISIRFGYCYSKYACLKAVSRVGFTAIFPADRKGNFSGFMDNFNLQYIALVKG